MTLLASPLFPDLVYLVLVGGLWLAALAMVAPGTGIPEISAIVALSLAGLGMLAIPINPWAVAVLAVGAILFGLSLWRRRDWAWLAGSAVALSLGSAFLFRVEDGGPAVHPVLAGVVSVLTLGYFWVAIRKALAAARARPTIDPSAVLGQIGEVRTLLDPTGAVYVAGELWTARADRPIPVGTRIRVRERDGLILTVEPDERS
jgi:membrane-bound serine protease (ClpP class)